MAKEGSPQQMQTDFKSLEFAGLVRSRDPKVVDSLVKTYTESLYKGALGLGFDASNAEELVQSVWVTFFEVAPNFRGHSHVRTFIFGILYNKASELRRHRQRFDDRDPIDDVMETKFFADGHWLKRPISPYQFMESVETMTIIQKCIDGLPLNQRMAFCLKEIDEHGSSDICNILGVTVTNLGVLLYRAKNRLRECIEGKARSAKS